MLNAVPHLRHLALMCTASLVYHREFVASTLHPNHVVHASYIFRNEAVLRHNEEYQNVVVVSYPWNDTTHAYSGIPPHIVLLQQMEQACQQQETLVNTFVDKV